MRVPRISPGSTQLRTRSQQTIRPEGLDTSGKGLSTIGKAVEGVGNEMYQTMFKARSAGQTAQAKLIAGKELADIDAKVLAKQGIKDWNDLSDFEADYKSVKSSTADIFSTKVEQSIFNDALDFEILNSQTKARTQLKKRWAREQKGVLVATRELNRDKFKRGDVLALQNQLKLIDDFVAADIIFPEEGEEEKISTKKEYLNSRFQRDAEIDRDKAKEGVEKGVYGDDSKDKETQLAYLVHLKNLEDKNTVLDKVNNRYTLIESVATGKEDIYNLSPQARQVVDNDDILAEAVFNATKSRRGYVPDEQNVEIVKVFKEASEATDRDALSSVASSLIYRSKTISPDKLGAILFYAQKKAVNLQLSAKIITPIGDETSEGEIEQKQIDAGINAISRWAKEWQISVDTHGQVITDYMKSIQSGEKPYDALNTTLRKTNIQLHPEMVNYPKEGQLITDDQGNLQTAFPDGSIKPVESRKKTSPQPRAESKSKELNFDELRKR